MSDEAFLQLIDEGVAELRPDIQAKLQNVAIVMADAPDEDQRAETGLGEDEYIFGLYEGVPQTERGVMDEVLLPDKITIFKAPILAAYSDPADIAECVKNTVWHEVAHHFGLDEDMVGQEEVRRGKTK